MATIVLQAAGAFLGGFLGPVGKAVGTAVGALAGYAIDRALINGTRRIEGPRLSGPRPFTAEEGASLPRIYGTMRVGGTLIWATRFEEVSTTTRQGGKGGGPRVTEYTYFANAAFALCEGPISAVRRMWADGREVDLGQVEIRIHSGTEGQAADPLVEARQGAGNTPAYRGTAYVVIDRLPIGEYGNRLPQFEFEVIRAVGKVAGSLTGVALIPGSTEYGLYPRLMTREVGPGAEIALNRHVLHGATDLTASLDELQALCPNLQHVGLVVTWFGDDLRAGACRIRPMVTAGDDSGFAEPWSAGGLTRATAPIVSYHEGGAAYGGTPSDRSVIEAIAEIRARGLGVTLYPFVMMDVPHGNGLPDPHGGSEQAAYPWRGRITCHPAPGRPGTVDKSVTARSQVEGFSGAAVPGDFSVADGSVVYGGVADDWGYRRLILHFANLAVAAGGVDAFLIGSELRGLTTVRDGTGAFPFVEQLANLAGEVRAIVGGATKITYGADWSEYFGYQPADGTGDAFFHLDPIWAHPAIDAIGIDNYMPLSDWRDGDRGGGNPDAFRFACDPRGLRASITGGEGFDWFYASAGDRANRLRTPITDGAYGKPWMFRYKDLVAWWSNPHVDRPGGVETGTPTAWVPRSKPIWLTELGGPAVDKGPNQPNVFPDPKSSESALPHFSSGGRSDLALSSVLAAHRSQWDPLDPRFEPAGNPVSPVYGARMVDPARLYAWAWDARPFPTFPLSRDTWSDGGNWLRGHWLNGRLSGIGCGDLIRTIFADHGLPAPDTDAVDGSLHGYIVSDPGTARAALEPLMETFGIEAHEAGGTLAFRSGHARTGETIELDDIAVPDRGPAVERQRAPDHVLPASAVIAYRDPLRNYQTGTARFARPASGGDASHEMVALPGALETVEAETLVRDWLTRRWSERDGVSFSVPAGQVDVEPGSIMRLPGEASEYVALSVEDGILRSVSARRLTVSGPAGMTPVLPEPPVPAEAHFGKPACLFLDLPMGPSGGAAQDQFRIASLAQPWRPQRAWASAATSGFTERALLGRPASMGRLAAALPPNDVEGRFDRVGVIDVELFRGELASASQLQVLNGANAAAILSSTGSWEIVQFESAEEIAPSTWRLTTLLRGQMGTTDAMLSGAAEGSAFVLIDEAVRPAGLQASEIGLLMNWRVGPSGQIVVPGRFDEAQLAGGVRALLPLPPAHLKAKRTSGGDLAVNWVRRGRLDADRWESVDIPLGEETEAYHVRIASLAGDTIRTAETATAHWTYGLAAISTDLPALPTEIDVFVSQISMAVGLGIEARMRITIH